MTDPFDGRLYTELGRIVVAWSHIEFLLKRLLAGLSNAPLKAAYAITDGMQAAAVLERCRWLAETSLTGDQRDRVMDWLQAAEAARKARNRMFHGAWGSTGRTGEATPIQVSMRSKKGRLDLDEVLISLDDVVAVRQQVQGVMAHVGALEGLL